MPSPPLRRQRIQEAESTKCWCRGPQWRSGKMCCWDFHREKTEPVEPAVFYDRSSWVLRYFCILCRSKSYLPGSFSSRGFANILHVFLFFFSQHHLKMLNILLVDFRWLWQKCGHDINHSNIFGTSKVSGPGMRIIDDPMIPTWAVATKFLYNSMTYNGWFRGDSPFLNCFNPQHIG